MNGYQYILAKQTEWARNHGIALIGSKIERVRSAYTSEVDHNLFQPLLPEVRNSFESGDGSELGSPGLPGKMQAIHSSSALAVNLFQYWKTLSQVSVIAAACGLCRSRSDVSLDVVFEEKYPIDEGFRFHPNIDVAQGSGEVTIKVFSVKNSHNLNQISFFFQSDPVFTK